MLSGFKSRCNTMTFRVALPWRYANASLDVRYLPLCQEPLPPVADAIAVSKQLRQRTAVQPFHDHNLHSLWSELGANELDGVGMVHVPILGEFVLIKYELKMIISTD
jgi:hypothetical protein